MLYSFSVLLKTRFIRSILFFSSSQAFGRIVHALAYAVLLKQLSPAEIGLVSISAAFLTILGAVSELGMGAALIQAPALNDRQKTGVFWTGILLAVIFCTALFMTAPLIANYFQEPYIAPLIRVYMLVLVINSLRVVPHSLLVRELKFGKISIVDSSSMLISAVIMVILAFRGFGPWSLVLGELSRALCLLIGTQLSLWYVPGIRFSFREISPLLRFGSFATGSRILYNFYTNIDYLIVGKFFGSTAVGIYTLAYRLVFDPVKAGAGIINQVAYPTFSKLQNDIVRLRRYFFSAARINLSILGMFLVLVTLFTDWAMLNFGYEEWLAAVPLIRILCIIGFLRCVFPLIPQLLNALGHSQLNFTYSALCAAVMPLVLYGGAQVSLMGVAWAWIFGYPIVSSLLVYYALRFLDLRIGDFIKEFVSPLKILLVFIPAILAIRILFEKVIADLSTSLTVFGCRFSLSDLSMLVAVILSLLIGITLVLAFDKPMAQELAKVLKRKKRDTA